MKNLRSLLSVSLIALALAVSPAHATNTSTINPNSPAQGSALSSGTLRANFLAAYNDVNTIYGLIANIVTSGITSLTGDVTTGTPASGVAVATVGKVNGVSYPASPSTNTVPVVTNTGVVTYEQVPNAALANSSLTIAGHAVVLGGVQTLSASDLTNGVNGTGAVVLATGSITGVATNITASSNSTLTTLPSLSLPATQLTGTLQAAQEPAHTGDVTNTAGSLALTMATVNSNTGSFGSSTAIPVITLDGKGRATAASTAAVVAPAGTLSGSTLASGVTASSLTSVGTLGNLTVTNPITGSVTGNAATVTTNANLIGPITSTGNATAVGAQTGSGSTFVMQNTPTLTTPVLVAATGTSVNLSGVATALSFSATGTGASVLPVGTTGQRPGSPVEGNIRDNTTLGTLEAYIGGAWQTLLSSSTNGLLQIAQGGTAASTPANAVANLLGAATYYSRNYGMACDGQYINVTTTANTAAISSTHTFTSADVGKQIAIPYAAAVTVTGNTHSNATLDTLSTTQPRFVGQSVTGPGIQAGTTIANIITTSSVQLSQAATATASGVSITFGYPLNTTIASVTAGAATLTAAPTISLTSTSDLAPKGNAAAFGTNDASAFGTLVTTVNTAGGGKIILQGMCVTSATTTWNSYVALAGGGADYDGLKWISTSDLTNNIITYPGTPSTHIYSTTFRDFYVDGWAATQATYNVFGKGINLLYPEKNYMENIHVYGTPATCLATDYPLGSTKHANILTRCGRLASAQIGGNGIGDATSAAVAGLVDTATDNDIYDPTNYGIFVEAQTAAVAYVQGTFSNNHIYQTLNPPTNSNGSAGIANTGSTGLTISSNTVNCVNATTTWEGFAISPGTTAQTTGAQSILSDNIVNGPCFRKLAIDYTVNALPNGTPAAIIVNGFLAMGGGSSEGTTSDGIYVKANNSFPIKTLKLANITTYNNGRCGILFTNGAQGITHLSMSNVQSYNNSATNSTAVFQSGICFNTPVADLTATSVDTWDDGTGTQKYGWGVNTGGTITAATITGSHFEGNATAPFNMVGTMTGILTGNYGLPAPTISGCSATSSVGNGDIGTYTSGTTGSCAVTITPYGSANILAPNFYECSARDATTQADTVLQTGWSNSSATITGVTASGDVIHHQCRAW